ncbi:MAG: serine/threonine-protein kinase [Acidimicrobiia bacterium]
MTSVRDRATEADELSAGTIVGSYRVARAIGRGADGVVYRAVDSRSGHTVALKVLRDGKRIPDTGATWVAARPRAEGPVRHPCVVPVLEVSDDPAPRFAVMPWVDGRDLRWLLEREPVLPVPLVAKLLREVAAGLDALHAAGMVHGDVKPSNILVGRLDPTEPVRAMLTDAGGGVTPGYAAPEVLCGDPVDGRSDVYALGVVLYECLAGTLPVEPFVDRDGVVALTPLHATPPALSTRRPDLPRALDAVLACAMAPRPDGRYSTCGELVAAARPHLRRGEQPTVPAPMPAATEPPSKPGTAEPPSKPGDVSARARPARLRLFAGLVIVLLLAAALVAVSAGSSGDHGSARPMPSSAGAHRAVAGLLAAVPRSLRDRCHPSRGHLPGARAEVACRTADGVVSVVYGRYADERQLLAAFRSRGREPRLSDPTGGVAGAGPTGAATATGEAAVAACADGGPEERTWRPTAADHRPAGWFRCSVPGGHALLTWTTTHGRVLAEAERPDADLRALYAWWQRVPGPLDQERVS